MMNLYPNILCRPGPSAIPAAGADFYRPMGDWTTNTLLDAFSPRPEDGTVQAPCFLERPLERPTDLLLQVARFDGTSAGLIADGMSLLLQQGEISGRTESLLSVTDGRWDTRFYRQNEELCFSGPSRRFVRISSTLRGSSEMRITVGYRGSSSGATQSVSSISGKPEQKSLSGTHDYSFYFKDQALEGLKTALGFPNLSTHTLACELFFRIFDSGQYSLRKGEIFPSGRLESKNSQFIIRNGDPTLPLLTLQGTANLLQIDINTPMSDFTPLRPALRETLWNAASATGVEIASSR